MTRILPDYSPLLEAVGTGKSRADTTQSQANVNFDERIARSALPITRMMQPDGGINKAAIKNANNTVFDDPYQMWEDLNANMPRGRGVDPVVFQEKYQSGKAMYDMNLANQINQMKQSGYSDKRIWKEFGEAPQLRQYAVENAILTPQIKSSGFNSTAAFIGSMAALQGGQALSGLAKTPTPTREQINALNQEGYKYQKGGKSPGIKRMTARDVLKLNEDDPLKKPVKKDFKYKKGKSVGKVNTRAYNKANKAYLAEKASRLSAAKEVVKTTKGREASYFGKQALKQGSKGVSGKMATNVALKSVGKTLGTQVGKGLGLRALGLFGGVPGLILSGAFGLHSLYQGLKKDSPTDTKSRWK